MNQQVKKILVVDDYPNWRDLLQHVLEGEGYVVQVAVSHLEAITKLEKEKFDVVILDMRLVDAETYNVQGMDLLKRLKKKAPNTGAVILTGYPDLSQKEKAIGQYGADAYLSKSPEGKDNSGIDNFDIDAFSDLVASLTQD